MIIYLDQTSCFLQSFLVYCFIKKVEVYCLYCIRKPIKECPRTAKEDFKTKKGEVACFANGDHSYKILQNYFSYRFPDNKL